MKDYLKYLPAVLVIVTLVGTTYVDRATLQQHDEYLVNIQKYIQSDQVEDAKIHTKQNIRLDYLEKQ